MSDQQHVLFSEHALNQQGKLGLITLNRPQAINALTKTMCQAIDQQLVRWDKADEIKFMVIQGNGERGFCAGGDVKQIYVNGINHQETSMSFFQQEYQMNRRIFHLSKPYVALLHGIAMGGGLGVSLHGSHVVAADNLKLAMPETGIGFYPDVGGSYFLSRTPDSVGMYLGLTGQVIDADAALTAKLIDYKVDHAALDTILARLKAMNGRVAIELQLSDILKQFATPGQQNALTKHEKPISRYFSLASMQAIWQALEQDNTEFAQQTFATLKAKSPLSLQHTFLAIQNAAELSFDQAMDKEYQLTEFFISQPDFYEGVRAAVVDKDRDPKWQ